MIQLINKEKIKEQMKRYKNYFSLTASQIGNTFVLHTLLGLTSSLYTFVLKIEYLHMYILLYGLYHFITIVEEPIVGLISDRLCFKKFKRRSFMIVGNIFMAISLITLTLACFVPVVKDEGSESVSLIESMNGNEQKELSDYSYTIIIPFLASLIGFISFAFIDVSSRSIVLDIVDSEFHFEANCVGSMNSSLFQIIFYLFAALFHTETVFYPIMIMISLIILIITTVVTCIFANENTDERLMLIDDGTGDSCSSDTELDSIYLRGNGKQTFSSKIRHCLTYIPGKLWLSLIFIFFAMAAYGCLPLNFTVFYKNCIFKSDETESNNNAISHTLYSMVVLYTSQTICSFIISFCKKIINIIAMLACVLGLSSFICYLVILYTVDTENIQDYVIGISYIPPIVLGFVFACMYTLPYSVIKQLMFAKDYGMAVSLTSAFCHMGFFVSSWVSIFISEYYHDMTELVIYYQIIMGFVVCVIAFPILFYVNPLKKLTSSIQKLL